jgi:hypothetical protein
MISKIADFWDVPFYSQASRHEEVPQTRDFYRWYKTQGSLRYYYVIIVLQKELWK